MDDILSVVEQGQVFDCDHVYRCIFFETSDGVKPYYIDEGLLRVSSTAFRDSSQAPSVDLARLCGRDPRYAQKNPEDGVVYLVCQQIRMIDDFVQRDSKGRDQFTYNLDVVYRPLPDNPAHAQIEPSPKYSSKSVFRRLQERLAYIVNSTNDAWLITPSDASTN